MTLQTSGAGSGSALERFKQQVWRDWTDEEIVAGWQRWYPKFAAQSHAATRALIQAARVKPGMHVLDLATGPGDPAITLADAVGPDGHVTATDLSPGMVAAAAANAKLGGMTNMSFAEADMEALPFTDGMFDAITCRFGIMFCPNTEQALSEVLRVLKPGGRAAFVVWGPPFEQGFISTTMKLCAKYTSLPECELGAPNAFNFAKTGKLSALMERTRFQQVQEGYQAVVMPWEGSAEEYWQYVSETATPLREMLQKIEDEGNAHTIPALIDELTKAYRTFADGQRLNFPATINVASGEKVP